MTGEYIIYKAEVVAGGINDNCFLIKKCNYTDSLGLREIIPYPTSKGLYQVTSEGPGEIKEMIDNAILI